MDETSQAPVLAPEKTSRPFPWEDRSLSFSERLLSTIKGTLIEPQRVFPAVRDSESIGDALKFNLLVGTLCSYVAVVYQFLFQGLSFLANDSRTSAQVELLGTVIAIPIVVVLVAIIVPLFIVINSFVVSGLYHVFLKLFGGANETFETSFRVIAYSSGAVAVFNIIPICGAWIGALWGIVVMIIGLTVAHATDWWRVFLAWFAPIFLCCCCIILIFFLVFGLAIFSTPDVQHLLQQSAAM